MTSLHLSAILNKPLTFKLLLERGADPKIADNDGETGEQLAAESAALRKVLEDFLGPHLATSLTNSHHERTQE